MCVRIRALRARKAFFEKKKQYGRCPRLYRVVGLPRRAALVAKKGFRARTYVRTHTRATRAYIRAYAYARYAREKLLSRKKTVWPVPWALQGCRVATPSFARSQKRFCLGAYVCTHVHARPGAYAWAHVHAHVCTRWRLRTVPFWPTVSWPSPEVKARSQ